MRLEIKSPADLRDMAELGGAMTRVQWAILRDMWASGPTWSLSVAGAPVALCGLYPLDEGGFEAWFNLAPAAAPHMLEIVRAVRLTLSAKAYGSIVTVCRTRAGKRFARAAGFAFHAAFDERPDLEVWIWKP